MNLSGWMRLWVVFSVLWLVGFGFYAMPKVPRESPGVEVTLKPGCELVADNPEIVRDSPLIASMCENSQNWVDHRAAIVKQWDEFYPLAALWFGAPIVLLIFGLVIRWVAAGFQTPSKKKPFLLKRKC